MGLEAATYISQLTAANPTTADNVSQGDDHIRLLKTVLQAQFTSLGAAAVTTTAAELNVLDGIPATLTATELGYVDGVTSAIQTQLDAKAPLASPTFTGTPSLPTGTTATTQTAGDNSTKLATTAYADTKPGAWQLITDTTISGTPSSVDFTSSIGSTYDQYLVTFLAMKPSTDAVALYMRTSTDGGSTYDASANDYRYAVHTVEDNAGNSATFSSGAAQILVAKLNVGNAAAENGVNGWLYFWKPSAALPLISHWHVVFLGSAGEVSLMNGAGSRSASADVDAIRFLFSTGTMASGRIKLFGRRV